MWELAAEELMSYDEQEQIAEEQLREIEEDEREEDR